MPPTKIAQIGYRRFDYQGRGSRASGGTLAPAVGWLRGPWGGYQPGLDPSQADANAAKTCLNLIDREGILTHMNGWDKVNSAKLPLGDAALPSATPEPVVGIFEGRTNLTQAVRRYAVTSDTTAGGGHFFELVSSVWTERTYTGAGTAFTGDSSDASATLVDAAHFAVGDYTVFVSGQGNAIYRFPNAGATNNYEALASLGALTSLRAQSCCVSDERIHVFGTTEGGTYFPARWRWTSKGANGAFDPSATGSGFADLNEFGGEAVAVRPIGPKIALYLNNGTMLARRTGITTDPFARDYTFYGRGLLGTKSVVDLGDGTHFGLFTDGWFRFSYNGQWEQRGLTDKNYYKWRQEFYNTLNWAQRKRVVCEYDENDHWVYIAFPTAGSGTNGPTEVWIYDLMRDTVWPMTTLGTQTPNVFGKWTEEVVAGATWGGSTGTWGGTSGSWGSLEGQVGRKRIVHGTGTATDVGGMIYQHLPSLVTRDGSLPTYLYSLVPFSGDRPDLFKNLRGVYVNYTRVLGNGADPTPISIVATSDSGKTFSGQIDHTKGPDRSQQEDFVSGSLSAQTHEVSVSGTAPVKIGGIAIAVVGSTGGVRKEGSV